jgi:8-oxo-dGTP pyrophosphatase MutT (NUDIX family)
MAFPGGHKAAGDQTFLETAVREAQEEVGIRLREHALLGVLPLVSTRPRRVSVAPLVFQLKQEVLVRSNEEVAESFWVPLKALSELRMGKSVVHVEEGSFPVDSYTYKGHVIWGLTFRIVNILLGRES